MFYSNEANLKNNISTIDDFFTDTLAKHYLATSHGQLYYAYAIPSNASTAIIISSGRIEGLDKYKELLWELYNNNIAVFIVDHQGQGRSYRGLKNPHKGFVKDFNDYAADLALFNIKVVDKHWQGKKVLLGHSMGGAIAYDYLARFEHNYNGLFLSAPMFDIYTKGTPKPLAKLAAKVASSVGLSGCYAFGQGDYHADDFAINTLTSSAARYAYFRDVYQQAPSLKLGGVTYGWLNAAFTFISKVDSLNVDIPLFIASAEQDVVVDNQAQHKIVKRLTQTKLKTYSAAKHELLFEQDNVRRKVLSQLYAFCTGLS
ncbi:MAG: alpha/beta fold hydrolase [Pseudoalteromonas sp.]|uniref:alpha/beta fold hydrolase n=1 Tax=unclassified Pseudoalteromonas TaxID=194690 RepID=UPI003F990BC2